MDLIWVFFSFERFVWNVPYSRWNVNPCSPKYLQYKIPHSIEHRGTSCTFPPPQGWRMDRSITKARSAVAFPCLLVSHFAITLALHRELFHGCAWHLKSPGYQSTHIRNGFHDYSIKYKEEHFFAWSSWQPTQAVQTQAASGVEHILTNFSY